MAPSQNGQISAIEEAKRNAAITCAKKYVPAGGCRLGVGSGSTVKHLVDYLAESYVKGELKGLVCIPTSYQTKRWLFEAKLPISDLDLTPELDVCIDGADEVDENFNLIKGGGGCLAREKIVQTSARKFYVIADHNKQSKSLGDKYKYIPIEVLPFAAEPLLRWLPQREGGTAELRMATKKCGPVITDNNNYIIDWTFDKQKRYDWRETQLRLNNTPGIVDVGLFCGVTDGVFFAYPDGSVKEFHPSPTDGTEKKA